ncbi:hypothetical protein O6H91_18G046400 [Diphasiastrum complanatum]|nr:hypothetical protein O6H91_18G046400 [Diphasiastrum complanatum]
MTFGEQNSYEEACRLLNMARDAGINFFDSAEMYPVPQRADTQGLSETYVGCWLKKSKVPRDRVVLATKATGPSGQMTWIRGGPHSLDKKNIKEAIHGSLCRLQTDYIDLYQLHWPDRYVPMFGCTDYNPSCSYKSVPVEEQLEALSEAVDSGKIRYIGLSNETPYGVMEFCRVSKENKAFPRVISIQNAYNLLCRTFDSGLAESCHQERLSLLAYSPLAMGLLSGKYLSHGGGPLDARLNLYKGCYAEAECRYNSAKPNVLPAIQAYVEVSRKYDICPITLAIGFVLKHPLVASVIIGATKLWQLKEQLDSCEEELTPEIIADIDLVHEKYPNPTP